MEKVRVSPLELKGKKGYDIKIIENDATVQDYIDALEKAFSEYPLSRNRNQVLSCEGCQHCCNERIPLTIIDIMKLMNYFKDQLLIKPETTISDFITRYTYVIIEGHSIDIMLRLKDEFCQFLNNKALCQHYAIRPFVCRTFFCCPASKRADELREIIVNLGEDELVRQLLVEVTENNLTLNIDETYDAEPDLDDWATNAYTGKSSYSEVKIRDLCSKKIWLDLTCTKAG